MWLQQITLGQSHLWSVPAAATSEAGAGLGAEGPASASSMHKVSHTENHQWSYSLGNGSPGQK